MTEVSPERARAVRRRHTHERQAVVFGGLIAGLAIAGLGATAIYTDVVSLPFLEREFSAPPQEEVAAVPDAPCPPEGTLPVAYNAIQVNVLNGSGRAGLAGATAETLTTRGFVVLGTGNHPVEIPTTAQISFGEAGLAAAYTLAAHVEAPALVLDTREDPTVDLVLGDAFDGLVEQGSIILDTAVPLVGVPDCVPFEQAVENAVPGPQPEPEEDEEFQDGGEGIEEAPEGEVPADPATEDAAGTEG